MFVPGHLIRLMIAANLRLLSLSAAVGGVWAGRERDFVEQAVSTPVSDSYILSNTDPER